DQNVQEFIKLAKRDAASPAWSESLGRAPLHPPDGSPPVLGVFRRLLHCAHVSEFAAGFRSAHLRGERAVAQHRTADIGRPATDIVGSSVSVAAGREDTADFAFFFFGEY